MLLKRQEAELKFRIKNELKMLRVRLADVQRMWIYWIKDGAARRGKRGRSQMIHRCCEGGHAESWCHKGG